MDFSPLIISLKTALISTVFSFLMGILIAYNVEKLKFFKGVIDGIITLPMVLPPTVVGFFLLKLFGVNGVVGKILLNTFDYKIIFTWPATIIASTAVAMPLMYRAALGAFEQLDKNLIYASRTLGCSNTYIFWKVIIPNSRAGILAGTVLAFARALGEFGATMMLAGNIPGKTRTISIAVYSAMQAGDDELAYKWVIVNLIISFFTIILINNLSSGNKKSIKKFFQGGV